MILDWPLRQKTGKRIRTFQSHMHDNGWDNVTKMSYYASDDMRNGTTTPLVARIRGLIVEMIMDVLSLDAQTVTDLEYACEGVSPLQFNVPQGVTGGNVRYHYKPDLTAHFNKQKMYHEEQRREGKAIGR